MPRHVPAEQPLINIASVTHVVRQGRSHIEVLTDLSLEVSRCEFVSILGPSGCGKTTLLHIIAGLQPHHPPTRGSVNVDGHLVRGPGRDRVLVFQDHAVYPWLTVEGNIRFALRRETREAAAERIDRCLRLTNLVDSRHVYPHQLSIGMRQRVGLARALAMQPKVLLMDEPFASVDALTRRQLQRELLHIYEVERTTVVFVTHSIEEAISLGSRVIVLSSKPSRIVDDIQIPFGYPRGDVETDPLFRELYMSMSASLQLS